MSRTMWFITGIFFLIISYDIWTVVQYGYESTVSWTLYTWAEAYPIIPFGLGVTCGHLWWPVDIRQKPAS